MIESQPRPDVIFRHREITLSVAIEITGKYSHRLTVERHGRGGGTKSAVAVEITSHDRHRINCGGREAPSLDKTAVSIA
jgi:hypothetical protein